MPIEQIPEEAICSPDTSLGSSNENVSSTRTTSSSEDIFIARDPYPEYIFSRQSNIRLAQMIPQRFQYEPKLDDLLRQVSGSSNLETLTDIQLRVMSSMVGLHRLNAFLPSLISLNLDGSSLNSLRDLGCGLKIKYLNVSRCGLRSFDGAAGLGILEHLVADCNQINNVNQLSALIDLKKLSLRSNSINDLGSVSFLTFCGKLKDLDLTSNPISQIRNYRKCIKDAMPDLLILDSKGFNENEMIPNKRDDVLHTSSSEFSSSLTTSSKISDTSNGPDINEMITSSNIQGQRASSSCEIICHIPMEGNDRPSTSSEMYNRRNSLSTGAPICGSIIAKVRRAKQQGTWTSSRSSSSSISSGDIILNSQPNFPIVLPQETIELELGILPPITSTKKVESKTETYDSKEIGKLLATAKKWRMRSQANRSLT